MMAKHRMQRHKTNWKLELRYYRYRISFYLGRLVRAYISRGKA
jgi:hypothetical protein